MDDQDQALWDRLVRDLEIPPDLREHIANMAERGSSVIVISSEMQELIGLCHRVLVMRGGRIAGEVGRDDLTEDAIVFLATGVHEQEAAEIAAGHG